jgi:ABC-type transport system substrate-binding protein
MSSNKSLPGLKGSITLFKPIFTMVLTLLLISFLAACAAPAATTQAPTSSAPATITTAPTTTMTAATKPQGELVGALQNFGNENLLPWTASMGSSAICDLVYDLLIYWDDVNRKYIPGLAERWEISPDSLTLTYHLRKGVQFQDGWGELTSADVKYNFEMQASPQSLGKSAQTRRIASMETPDPYTLIVHFKDPYPTFWMDLSMGGSTVFQGIVSKKYVETVGEDIASMNPIGSGPYKQVGFKSGSYYKLEALDSHWRVVPEFKYLTLNMIPETSTLTAALKNREIDLALNVSAEQLDELKAVGLATEYSPSGGGIIMVSWGGIAVPEDRRYDAEYHNKDPWTDVRVRKAMTIAIDRQAICKALYNNSAFPAGVVLFSVDMDKYQYPYDPVTAKQLLEEAGYPNGFSFKAMSYALPSAPESPRIMEALVGYWQQIGLDPKITMIEYAVFNANYRHTLKTAGGVSLIRLSAVGDNLSRVEQDLMPDGLPTIYEDEGSWAIFKGNPKSTLEERQTLVDKLNQYYYDNFGPIPVIKVGMCYAWNPDKISPWPHSYTTNPTYFEYVRHAQPLNTYRLFNPWPDR